MGTATSTEQSERDGKHALIVVSSSNALEWPSVNALTPKTSSTTHHPGISDTPTIEPRGLDLNTLTATDEPAERTGTEFNANDARRSSARGDRGVRIATRKNSKATGPVAALAHAGADSTSAVVASTLRGGTDGRAAL